MTNKKQRKHITPYSVNDEYAHILERLIQLGLTQNDSRVYILLLERGIPLVGSKIALRLSMHRQYVHNSLLKLLSLELIEKIPSGVSVRYKALPPQYLTRVVKKQLDTAEQVARELDKISTVGAEQDFEIYRGTEQVFLFEETFVQNLPENAVQYIIGGGSEAFINFFGERYEEISTEAQSRGLQTKYVGCREEIPWLERAKAVHKDFEYKILDSLPKTIVQTVIRLNTVTFYTFGSPVLVYVIKSKAVASDYKKFFDMLSQMAQ